FLTEAPSDLESTATRTMASTPLVIMESICSCWVATSALALAYSIVQRPHSFMMFFSSKGLSCVSQRAVVASGSSRAIFGEFPPAEAFPVPDPQADRATAVETAVMTTAAPRMQAFMCETSLRARVGWSRRREDPEEHWS